MPSQDAAYDLTILLDSSADEAQRAKALEDARKTITAGGGEVASGHDWGTRRTAYEIGHQSKADFHLIQFVGPAALPATLDRQLRIADGVVRARIIRRPGGPGAVPDIGSMPEPAATAFAAEEAPVVERL